MTLDILKIAVKTAVDVKVGRISLIKNMGSISQLFFYKYDHKTFETINLEAPKMNPLHPPKSPKRYIKKVLLLQKKLFGQSTQYFY